MVEETVPNGEDNESSSASFIFMLGETVPNEDNKPFFLGKTAGFFLSGLISPEQKDGLCASVSWSLSSSGGGGGGSEGGSRLEFDDKFSQIRICDTFIKQFYSWKYAPNPDKTIINSHF